MPPGQITFPKPRMSRMIDVQDGGALQTLQLMCACTHVKKDCHLPATCGHHFSSVVFGKTSQCRDTVHLFYLWRPHSMRGSFGWLHLRENGMCSDGRVPPVFERVRMNLPRKMTTFMLILHRRGGKFHKRAAEHVEEMPWCWHCVHRGRRTCEFAGLPPDPPSLCPLLRSAERVLAQRLHKLGKTATDLSFCGNAGSQD